MNYYYVIESKIYAICVCVCMKQNLNLIFKKNP